MRIMVASADRMFRLALQLLLESEPGMAVIGISDRVDGLLTVMNALQSDVLLLDDQLAKQATAELIGNVRLLPYSPKTIVLSIDPDAKMSMLAAGAHAFIDKRLPPDDLLPILRSMRLEKIPAGYRSL